MSYVFNPKEVNVNPAELKSRVYNLLVGILKDRFPSVYSKHEIRQYKNRLNFACPYCGDSVTDTFKKRGNLFLDSWSFHCYRGDCGRHESFISVLKDFGHLKDFSTQELDWVVDQTKINQKEQNKSPIKIGFEEFISIDLDKVLPTREQVMSGLRLFEIYPDSPMDNYLIKRSQRVDKKFAWQPKTKRLIIFNLSSCGNYVLGFQIKTFNLSCPYLTYDLNKIYTEILNVALPPDLQEFTDKLNRISRIFNILNVDLTLQITVFEGPLDSFLWKNSVAISGVGNDFPIEAADLRFFLDNDKAGNIKSMEYLKQGHMVFLWKKFFTDRPDIKALGKIKDLNDLIIKCKINKISLSQMEIKNCFSNNKLDCALI